MKPTDALNYNFIRITTLHVLGNLSAHHQEFLAVYIGIGTFLQIWWPFATRSILLLVANGHEIRCWCMAKNAWWWAERLPETCRVGIPI